MTQVANQNNASTPAGIKAISGFLNSNSIKQKFTELLGQRAPGFIASVLSTVNSSNLLANSDQNSIYTAALIAASLDLPINPSLGLAYIVPYAGQAQFQLGYKGFRQLALRSGQFININETEVREGEIKHYDRLTGHIDFEWIEDDKTRLSKKIVGYVSFFELTNGFRSTFYMTVEQIEEHAKKYSQTYKKYGTGLWKDEKPGMSLKTVCKLHLSKKAPLSIDLQRAIKVDQAVIKNYDPGNEDTLDVETEYVDNSETAEDRVEDAKAEIKEGQQSGEQGKINLP